MNTVIALTTLGQLRVERNGQILDDFVSAKAVLLLVYLAMHPGEHPRKKLASLLWSETTDEQALKNLRTVLSSIRQKLEDALLIERDTLSINPDVTVIVDAEQFETGCKRAFAAVGILDLAKSMQELIALYQGDFLEGVVIRDAETLDEWVTEKQRQLQHLYRQLVYEFIDVAQKRGLHETGLHYAWRLTALDPLWDAAQRQLMRLLVLANRPSEALLQYERFVTLLDEELGAEPEDETIALYEKIRGGDVFDDDQAEAAPSASISLPDMPFIEPAEAVDFVQRMLSTPQCRLLTMYGISGIGKTALAIQVAYHRQHSYRDGAHFISLKRSHTARDLPYLIAAALGIEFGGAADHHALETVILQHLRTRSLLLVLDNYEVVLPETDLVQRILEDAQQVQLMIISQMPLNLFREWVLPLTGLRYPKAGDNHPETYEAVRLFELIARRSNPQFNLSANLEGVAQICRLVDGLPLAIVIAAGWTQILPIQKIIDHIQEGQEFILPIQQSLPPHQQSMEMMLEYTWSTLTDAEQKALTALAIFNTAFDFDEIQQICGVDIGALASLIQRSLIQKFDDKYRMHQVIWRHVRRKLLFSPLRETLCEQYLAYYRTLLERLGSQTPLHEYLATIEALFPSIWNYDWMPKSYQPIYILSVCRYLMIYWEVSRMEDIPQLQALLQSLDATSMPADKRHTLHLLLARTLYWTKAYDRAQMHLTEMLRGDLTLADWNEIALALYFYASLNQLRTQEMPLVSDTDTPDEIDIIRMGYYRLALMYLDSGEHSEADAVLSQLLELPLDPVQQAALTGVKAILAVQMNRPTSAQSQLREAESVLGGGDPYLVTLFPTLHQRLRVS